MARQTASQKQLITLRQGVILLAIFVLSVFAFKYAQNVMRIRAAQDELVSLESAVEQVKAQQAAADEGFINSISPGYVDEVAKNELGLVRQGEMIYIPVPAESSSREARTTHGETSEMNGSQEDAQPNWRLWLALVTD